MLTLHWSLALGLPARCRRERRNVEGCSEDTIVKRRCHQMAVNETQDVEITSTYSSTYMKVSTCDQGTYMTTKNISPYASVFSYITSIKMILTSTYVPQTKQLLSVGQKVVFILCFLKHFSSLAYFGEDWGGVERSSLCGSHYVPGKPVCNPM